MDLKKKAVCFIANFYKTCVFDAISVHLQSHGIAVYWIVPKDSQYRDLVTRYGTENVLSINRDYITCDCAAIGDFKLHELVYGDRVWRHEKENGIKYLTNIQYPVYEFIKKHTIHYIFGEMTWAHELLIYRICRLPELNCRYYSHGVTRIPNGRMCFFTDENSLVC